MAIWLLRIGHATATDRDDQSTVERNQPGSLEGNDCSSANSLYGGAERNEGHTVTLNHLNMLEPTEVEIAKTSHQTQSMPGM